MEFKLRHSKITDLDIKQKISDKIKVEEYDLNKEYDVSIEYYNEDIIDEKLNEDIMFEMKSEHYRFLKLFRNLCKNYKIIINNVYLLGTISNLKKEEIIVSFNYAKEKQKENIIWPCKEIFLYDGSKKVLDNMLDSNQITLDEYNKNLEILQDEFGIYEAEEELGYIN